MGIQTYENPKMKIFLLKSVGDKNLVEKIKIDFKKEVL